jgi:hypothetical protein
MADHIAKVRSPSPNPAAAADLTASVVDISSIAAIRPRGSLVWYNASKAAVSNASKALAHVFGGRGIGVNSVCPVLVPTQLANNLVPSFKNTDEGIAEAAKLFQILLGRLTTAEDVASVSCWLAEDGSSFITGMDHHVDGGRSNDSTSIPPLYSFLIRQFWPSLSNRPNKFENRLLAFLSLINEDLMSSPIDHNKFTTWYSFLVLLLILKAGIATLRRRKYQNWKLRRLDIPVKRPNLQRTQEPGIASKSSPRVKLTCSIHHFEYSGSGCPIPPGKLDSPRMIAFEPMVRHAVSQSLRP